MFEKFDEATNDILAASRHECMRQRCTSVGPEHLLLAVTRDSSNIGARVLSSMNVKSDSVAKEVEKAVAASGRQEPDPPMGFSSYTEYEDIVFSEEAKTIFERANDFRLFFGRDKVAPEHLLLGLIELDNSAAIRILEELGANITFLRRQIMSLIAKQDCLSPAILPPGNTVVRGISEIIWQHVENMEMLNRLASSTDSRLPKLPERAEVVLMVFLGYLPDFLLTQVAYQRYLLEETIRLLHNRSGALDKEVIGSIVSTAAQNLRSEVRLIIEHLWTQEYRMLSQMPDEAEQDEIGSVIEDLWWTYSEEIALHEVFDSALDDYRRKQVLDLQKRKLEISARLGKTRTRLEQTLRQCFLKRSLSA